MDARFRLLGRRRREKIREVTRAAYIDNPATAAEKAEQVLRRRYGSLLSMLLMGLVVKLIVELVAYWISRQLSRPSVFYQAGEPGAEQ